MHGETSVARPSTASKTDGSAILGSFKIAPRIYQYHNLNVRS